MNNIIWKQGNLLESRMQTLTNTINTVGVRGAGIAKAFKERFPEMFEDYRQKCENGEVETGWPYLWVPEWEGNAWILNFPTKRHWRNDSQIEWIDNTVAKSK